MGFSYYMQGFLLSQPDRVIHMVDGQLTVKRVINRLRDGCHRLREAKANPNDCVLQVCTKVDGNVIVLCQSVPFVSMPSSQRFWSHTTYDPFDHEGLTGRNLYHVRAVLKDQGTVTITPNRLNHDAVLADMEQILGQCGFSRDTLNRWKQERPLRSPLKALGLKGFEVATGTTPDQPWQMCDALFRPGLQRPYHGRIPLKVDVDAI